MLTHVKAFYKQHWLEGSPKDALYFNSGENALYLGSGAMGGGYFGGLGPEGFLFNVTENQMREQLRLAYNKDLARVIAEVAKLGGTFEGHEVRELSPTAAETKIEIISVKRLIH